MVPFTPSDWYWHATDGRIYSSAQRKLVPADDAALVRWLAGGKVATMWPRDDAGEETVAALQAVLALYGLTTGLEAV